MMPFSIKAVLVGTLPLLAACALLQRPQEMSTYAPALLPDEQFAAPAAAASWHLVVEEPQALAPFDGTRMAVAPTPGELQFYKGARWRDRAPLLLQDLLLQAFDRAAPQVAAARAPSPARAEFVLRSDLRALTAEYHAAPSPTVEVRLAVQLLQRSNGRVVATHVFEVERACSGERLPQVFAAFEQALSRVAAEVVDWTVVEAERETGKAR